MPRKALDGAKLAADVSKLEREDQTSPPTAQPSLMDAVRALASYIETRARLGWTDPMIAVVLSKAGYPISAETLRSYRKRLRDEGLMAPLPDGKRKAKIGPPAHVTNPIAPTAAIEPVPAAPIVEAAPAIVTPVAMPATVAAIPAVEEAAAARAPPDQNPPQSPARTFRVDPTKLPPDQA